MKLFRIIPIFAILAAIPSFGGRKPVFLNVDDTHFASSRSRFGMTFDEAECRRLVSQYRATDITDLVLCCGGRIADIPGMGKESWLDKYHQTTENGRAVCYTNHPCVRPYHEMYEVRKIDPFALWIDEARKCGIRPWFSYRMNDCHDNSLPTSFLHPSFFHDHPEFRRIRSHAPTGYFDRCFDYACEDVRKRELNYIANTLDKYGPDGIEIDWQREVFCFQPGCEDTEVMTAFMREVRKFADKAAKKWGHPVRIAVRTLPDPENALELGFDVATWAHDGLVDVVVPCPRWETNNSDIPIALWKRLLRGTRVTLAPGLELLTRVHGNRAYYTTVEQFNGLVASFYSLGGDAIYVFNYFDDVFPGRDGHYFEPQGNQSRAAMAVDAANQAKWLHLVGDPDAMIASPRCHTLLYDDIVPPWKDVRRPFPRTIRRGGNAVFRVQTGHFAAGAKVCVRIGLNATERNRPRVYVNSVEAAYRGTVKCEPEFTQDRLFVYDIPDFRGKAAVVEVFSSPSCDTAVSYLDVRN